MRLAGYQPEMDIDLGDATENRVAQADRIIRFLRNPENVRAVMGQGTFEADGRTRRLVDARRAITLDSLRAISENPKIQFLAV